MSSTEKKSEREREKERVTICRLDSNIRKTDAICLCESFACDFRNDKNSRTRVIKPPLAILPIRPTLLINFFFAYSSQFESKFCLRSWMNMDRQTSTYIRTHHIHNIDVCLFIHTYICTVPHFIHLCK